MRICKRNLVVILVGGFLSACPAPSHGVSGEPGTTGSDAGSPPGGDVIPGMDGGLTPDASGSPETGIPTRIELSANAVMITTAEGFAALDATVFDDDGTIIPDVSVIWTFTNGEIAERVEGGVQARGEWGSTQVQATLGTVKSAPALVLVAEPAGDAVLVSDEQVGTISVVDPDAELDIGWQYQVEVRGLEPPAVGTLLIGTGDAGISGRVVAVTTRDDGLLITMEAVAPATLFANLEIQEEFDTKYLDYEVDDELAGFFQVIEPQEGWIRLVPHPHLRNLGDAAELLGNFAGAMKCKSQGRAPAVEATGMQIDAKVDNVHLDMDWSGGQLRKLMLKGELKSEISFPLQVSAAFEGEIKCTTQLIKFPIAIGPLGPLFGPAVELGAGFSISGRSTLASFSVEPYSETSIGLGYGYRCGQDGSCGLVNDFDPRIESGVTYGANGLWANDPMPMLEGSAKAFAYANLELGARFPGSPISAGVTVIEIEGGLKAEATLMSPDAQVRDGRRSSQGVGAAYLEAGIPLSFGRKLQDLFRVNIDLVRYNWELPLFRSPVGEVEQLTDQFPLVAGEPVTVRMSLTPPHHEFFGRYNVEEVVVYHYNPALALDSRFTEIGRVSASEGQMDFELEWEPTVPQLQAREDAEGNEVLPWLHVFFVPKIGLIEGLELEWANNARIGLGPGLAWVADAPVRTGGEIIDIRTNGGTIDDDGRLGFCGTAAGDNNGAFIWTEGIGIVDMTQGRFTGRRFGGCFIANGTGITAVDTGAGFNLIRNWDAPGEQLIIGYGEGFREHQGMDFGAAISWGNRNSNGEVLFYTIDQGGGYDPFAGYDEANIRIANGNQLRTVHTQRNSLMMRPLMSESGEVVWTDDTGVVRLSSGRRLGGGDAGLSPGISDHGGRVGWVENGSVWLTSAADGWLPIEMVNPAQHEAVSSVQPDTRVGVGFASGVSGMSAFTVFIGTNPNGQQTLFVAQIPEGTTSSENVAVQALATAGEAIAGVTPTAFQLNDPISPEGHIVSRVDTGGGAALLRFMKE